MVVEWPSNRDIPNMPVSRQTRGASSVQLALTTNWNMASCRPAGRGARCAREPVLVSGDSGWAPVAIQTGTPRFEG